MKIWSRCLLVVLLCVSVLGKKRPYFRHQRKNHSRGATPQLAYEYHGLHDTSLADSHLVVDLPLLPEGYEHLMYAGDVSVDEPTLHNKGSLFYWFLESQGNPETDPVVIWLNGGPGCSSMEGLLIEHGPFLSKSSEFELELNPYSWNRNANMLYLDQPVGTGFARVANSEFARSQKEINVMFMAFLRRWRAMFPRYQNHSLYLSGESYAGRYIPHFAHEILADGTFNLQGVLIGNGWTHPMIQTEALPEYSFHQGIITAQQKQEFEALAKNCRYLWESDPFATETWNTCELLQNGVPALSGTAEIGMLNIYDVRLYDPSSGEDWPWRATGEHAYLNRPDVRKALHVTSNLLWEECSDDVERYITHEDMYPTHKEFQNLLPHIRVLVYNGQFDWICNHVGVERFLETLEFEGREKFAARGYWVTEKTRQEEEARKRREAEDEAEIAIEIQDQIEEAERKRIERKLEERRRKELKQAGSRLAGYAKSGGNLTYVLVLGGSHMVPMDKRAETSDLLNRFLRNQSFTVELPPEQREQPERRARTRGSSNAFVTTNVPHSSPFLSLALLLGVCGLSFVFCRRRQKERDEYISI